MSEKKRASGIDGKKPGSYPDEIGEQAVNMFSGSRSKPTTRAQCATRVASLLGIGAFEAVLNWLRQAEADGGQKPGVATEEHDGIRRLKRENAELQRANGILKAASAFFAA